jgi:hypothetical protein
MSRTEPGQTTISEHYNWPLPLDSLSLSWITEEAEGRRDKSLVLVENIGLQTVTLIEPDEFDAKRHKLLIDVLTTNVRADRIKIQRLTMTPEEAHARDLPVDIWDALFWSEAAIEKFFIPYYVSQRLLEPEDWQYLKEALEDRELIAIAHFTPSRPAYVMKFETGMALHIQDGELTFTGVAEYVARLKRRVTRRPSDREEADRAEV